MGTLEAIRVRPRAALAGVAWYDGYQQQGVAPGLHRGLPSPWLTLIFSLHDPLTVLEHPDPRQPGGDYLTLAGGLHTRPALVAHQGRQSGIQVAVSPLACRALFGRPAGELAQLDVPATEVLDVAAQVHERLRDASGWQQRFAVVDDLLGRAVQDVPGPAAEVTQAWRRLHETAGRLSVQALAAEVGWSPRHLSAQLAVETGLTTKAAARVIRFDRLRRALHDRAAAGRRPELAALASAYGYYDQAHLARDFREFAGCSALQWLGEEFRSVQDAA